MAGKPRTKRPVYKVTLNKALFYDLDFQKIKMSSYIPLTHKAYRMIFESKLPPAYKVHAIEMLRRCHDDGINILLSSHLDGIKMALRYQDVLEKLQQFGVVTDFEVYINSLSNKSINTGKVLSIKNGEAVPAKDPSPKPTTISEIKDKLQLAMLEYPNRIDKEIGLKIILEQVQSVKEADDFLLACKNYHKHARQRGLGPFDQIPFAVFCQPDSNRWRKYIDYKPDTALSVW